MGLDRLSRESIASGLRGLRKFSRDLDAVCPSRVRIVATQSLRQARNRDDFLHRGEDLLGLPMDLISGDEEARLIYAGVSYLYRSPHRRLVIDIGGRSTELVSCAARTGAGKPSTSRASKQGGGSCLDWV